MDRGPTNDTVGSFHGDLSTVTELGTVTAASRPDDHHQSTGFINILFLVTVLAAVCGSVGNGTVIWLLGFRVKRNPFSVYILNLACADFTLLLGMSVQFTLFLVHNFIRVLHVLIGAIVIPSYLCGLCLLMAVSTERCISVLCPIWYRCHRPVHLSSIVCALIWALSVCWGVSGALCGYIANFPCDTIFIIENGMSFLTFLVLCVSSLTLLIRVQCSSRRRQPTKLYATILLNVLAFLLLGLPYGANTLGRMLSSSFPYYEALPIVCLLSALNSGVNPIIYFFVGRHGQQRAWKSLRDVLQSALADEEEGPLSSTTHDGHLSPGVGSSAGTTPDLQSGHISRI